MRNRAAERIDLRMVVCRPGIRFALLVAALPSGLLVPGAGVFAQSPEAVAHYERGLHLVQVESQYEEALTDFQRALELETSFAHAAFGVGRCWAELGRLNRARDHFKLALASDPPAALAVNAMIALGHMEYLLGDLDAAKTALSSAYAHAPRDAHLAELRSKVFARLGDLNAAIAEYKRLLTLDVESAFAHRGLAAAYLEQGAIQPTIHHAERAVELDPFSSSPYFLLSKARAREGRRDTARREMERHHEMQQYEQEIEALEKQSQKEPADAQLGFALAARHVAQGNDRAAVIIYEDLLNSNVAPLETRNRMALVRMRQGELEEAEVLLGEATRLDPAATAPHVGLGEIHAARGEWERAATSFTYAVERDPRLEAAHVGLLKVLVMLGDRQRVLVATERWTQTAPGSALAWAEWGTVCYRLGDVREASASLERALILDPDNLPAANNLAWILAETGGELDRALRLVEHVIQREPIASAYDTLAYVHERRGHLADAIDAIERAIRLAPEDETFRTRLDNLRSRAETKR